MTGPLRIAALGIGPFVTDAAELLREAEAGIRALSAEGAALVLLPELFALPFYAAEDPLRWRHAAENLDGPTCRWAGRVAAATGIAIVFGMPLAAPGDGRPANAAILAAPGAAPRLVQRKVHLAPPAGEPFGESDHFAAGPAEIEVFEYLGARFCALVCYDRRFPESWRAAGRQAADAVLVLVAGPTADPPGIFEAELRTHARANAVYALAASRFGTEEATGQRHDGATLAVGPSGALLPSGERTAILDVEPALLESARDNNPTHRRLRLSDQASERAYA